jgi:pyruvate/2-oxoglutarate dehydrogenase complex dihydrolipoamide acyltransferase (E2) component
MIPHVTNHDDADITDLEDFRVRLNKEIEKSGRQGQHAVVHDQGRRRHAEESFPSSTLRSTATT